VTTLAACTSFLAFALPSQAEFVEAIPVILSLIIIEGLLSVDNALAIAAMANHLPEKQKYLALKLGIIGAYFFRGLCLFFAASIIENPWLKILGAAYLLYLMFQHFAHAEKKETDENLPSKKRKKRGLLGTIIAIEIMDLSLSVDNVVAAVALSPKLWVVCTGVFLGILALRFVAGACIRLIEKFPILADTAFLLIGYVGFILIYEMLSTPGSGFHLFPGPSHVTTFQKFIGIVLILAASLFYSKSPAAQRFLSPLLSVSLHLMSWAVFAVEGIFAILFYPIKILWKKLRPASL